MLGAAEARTQDLPHTRRMRYHKTMGAHNFITFDEALEIDAKHAYCRNGACTWGGGGLGCTMYAFYKQKICGPSLKATHCFVAF